MIAANIDVAFIVQACGFDFNPGRLDRYLVMAGEGGITPWVILTKTDLVTPAQLEEAAGQVRHGGISTRTLPSATQRAPDWRSSAPFLAPGKTHCLLGSLGRSGRPRWSTG
ncbi:MAG: GTPase RsgA [Kiritimatiellia bacterium]